jgi:hypothetical protein
MKRDRLKFGEAFQKDGRESLCSETFLQKFNKNARLYWCNSGDVPQIGAMVFALVVSVPNTCANYRVIPLFAISFYFKFVLQNYFVYLFRVALCWLFLEPSKVRRSIRYLISYINKTKLSHYVDYTTFNITAFSIMTSSKIIINTRHKDTQHYSRAFSCCQVVPFTLIVTYRVSHISPLC